MFQSALFKHRPLMTEHLNRVGRVGGNPGAQRDTEHVCDPIH
jgi:hypothetical protein